MTPIISVKAFKCVRCGWLWLSRQYLEDGKTIPIACARCKSPYWNKLPATSINKEKERGSKNKK